MSPLPMIGEVVSDNLLNITITKGQNLFLSMNVYYAFALK